MSNYLTNMPTDELTKLGLQKTLITRKETIYLKHIMKNVFLYGNEENLSRKLELLQFKSVFQYVEFLTNKLRGIYKISRKFKTEDINDIVKLNRASFFTFISVYKSINPLVIIDFDKTITNDKFHNLYKWLKCEGFRIIINSENPNKNDIISYLKEWDLPIPKRIYANKTKKQKVIKLKDIASRDIYTPIFYIDDELKYLELGVLLGMYCYEYTKQGKIHTFSGFIK